MATSAALSSPGRASATMGTTGSGPAEQHVDVPSAPLNSSDLPQPRALPAPYPAAAPAQKSGISQKSAAAVQSVQAGTVPEAAPPPGKSDKSHEKGPTTITASPLATPIAPIAPTPPIPPESRGPDHPVKDLEAVPATPKPLPVPQSNGTHAATAAVSAEPKRTLVTIAPAPIASATVAPPVASMPTFRRGPGRPRKNPTVSPAAPSSNAVSSAKPAHATPVKRGPGRPKKKTMPQTVPANAPVTVGSPAAIANPVTPARRGPGRPPKNATTPVSGAAQPTSPSRRGPGRPRKNVNLATSPAATGSTETVPASTLVKTQGASAAVALVPSGTLPVANTKPTAATTPVRRGPGRPRKHPLKPAAAATPAAVVPSGNASVAPVTPVRRGPGRPRKNPLPIAPTTAHLVKSPPTEKRQPDTTPVPVTSTAPVAVALAPMGSAPMEVVKSPASLNLVRRGPGRPRKNSLPPSAAAAAGVSSSLAVVKPTVPNALVSTSTLNTNEATPVGAAPIKVTKPPTSITPVRRGPGRPRKSPLPASTIESAPAASPLLTKKPATLDVLVPAANSAVVAAPTSVSPMEGIEIAAPVTKLARRGPGRPRKHPLTPAATSGSPASGPSTVARQLITTTAIVAAPASVPTVPSSATPMEGVQSSIATTPVKRGPGRPRKNPLTPTGSVVASQQTQAQPQIKITPAKPITAVGSTASPGSPMRRGPGRPRKNASPPAASPSEELKPDAPAKRGRGRPRKSESAKGPGRPRKEITDATEEKRGPGRPRKLGVASASPIAKTMRARLIKPAPSYYSANVLGLPGVFAVPIPAAAAAAAVGAASATRVAPRLALAPQPLAPAAPVNGTAAPANIFDSLLQNAARRNGVEMPLPAAATLGTDVSDPAAGAAAALAAVAAASIGTPPIQRKRGRPRKTPEPADPNAPPRRGAGRPRKSDVGTTPKRPVGRPRKDGTSPAITGTHPVKRGPGRPRKNSLPLGVTIKPDLGSAPDASPVVVGAAPPSVPTTAVVPAAVIAPAVAVAPAAPIALLAVNQPVPAPSASKEPAVVVKRGPGRPRKSLPADGVTPVEDVAAPVLKRGRGRPRKRPLEEGSTAGAAQPRKLAATGRGPGRPRKHPVEQFAMLVGATQALSSATESVPIVADSVSSAAKPVPGAATAIPSATTTVPIVGEKAPDAVEVVAGTTNTMQIVTKAKPAAATTVSIVAEAAPVPAKRAPDTAKAVLSATVTTSADALAVNVPAFTALKYSTVGATDTGIEAQVGGSFFEPLEAANNKNGVSLAVSEDKKDAQAVPVEGEITANNSAIEHKKAPEASAADSSAVKCSAAETGAKKPMPAVTESSPAEGAAVVASSAEAAKMKASAAEHTAGNASAMKSSNASAGAANSNAAKAGSAAVGEK